MGIAGFWLHYNAPQPPVAVAEPVQAELITVEVSKDPLLLTDPGAPPAAPAEIAPPEAPPPAAVAEPSPAIAFALPVEGPTQIVNTDEAGFAKPTSTDHLAPVVTRLTYGRGEGAQPAPDYPEESIAARQEGVVGVRFRVGESGRVTAAEVISPTRWPLLNQSAIVTVRRRWRFRAGSPRAYEVFIRFQLH